MQVAPTPSLALPPLLRPAENRVENCGAIFEAEKRPSIHHVCHAFHHNFTTIYHHAAPQNPQKPLQNRHSTTPN
jgi:hypothetical protein